MSKKESAAAPSRSSVNIHEPCSVDIKGRVLLSKEIREEFSGDVHLVQDIQRVIRVYTQKNFEEEEQILRETFSRGNRSASKYRMAYLSNARRARVDAAGRLLIPAEFRAWVGIDKKCVVIANGEEFMIMTPEDYAAWNKSPSTFRSAEDAELELLREKAYAEEQTLQSLRGGVKR